MRTATQSLEVFPALFQPDQLQIHVYWVADQPHKREEAKQLQYVPTGHVGRSRHVDVCEADVGVVECCALGV